MGKSSIKKQLSIATFDFQRVNSCVWHLMNRRSDTTKDVRLEWTWARTLFCSERCCLITCLILFGCAKIFVESTLVDLPHRWSSISDILPCGFVWKWGTSQIFPNHFSIISLVDMPMYWGYIPHFQTHLNHYKRLINCIPLRHHRMI